MTLLSDPYRTRGSSLLPVRTRPSSHSNPRAGRKGNTREMFVCPPFLFSNSLCCSEGSFFFAHSSLLSHPPSFLPSFPPSLMQVFADYLKFFSTHGPGPRFLPTPCFYYGMEIGKEFTQTFSLPSSLGE